ncbi:hypothetical protein AC249_AIPGENE10929 [Exaiptasia diaphana]|nr:hypothetical protein AC249_AIPGENE10929 [Exaiptasia diaphana]
MYKYLTSTLKDEFKPNTEQMEELCKLLNKSNCKGWQHLAALWEIEDTTYYYYIPDTKASPTTILFDWLMMRRPDFTAYEISVICCQLKRNDASETLAKHLEQFYKNCEDSSATISYLTLLAVIEADAKRRC